MLTISVHAATPGETKRAPPPSCKEAVAQSRLICVTGSTCQKEIGQILRLCSASKAASCAKAREDLRVHCSHEAAWDDTRDCNAALERVRGYCAR